MKPKHKLSFIIIILIVSIVGGYYPFSIDTLELSKNGNDCQHIHTHSESIWPLKARKQITHIVDVVVKMSFLISTYRMWWHTHTHTATYFPGLHCMCYHYFNKSFCLDSTAMDETFQIDRTFIYSGSRPFTHSSFPHWKEWLNTIFIRLSIKKRSLVNRSILVGISIIIIISRTNFPFVYSKHIENVILKDSEQE